MEIQVDLSQKTSVYLQIVDQIQNGILNLKISPGTSLPSIRQLARDLGLNPNTVAKAYALLEQRRITETAGRRGTIVKKDAANYCKQSTADEFLFKLEQLFEEVLNKGLTYCELTKLTQQKLKFVQEKGEAK